MTYPGSYPLPSALASQTRFVSLGNVPALVAHPNWEAKVPFVIWMHGRTVDKTIDNGRYLRWIRAGLGAIALDLPGHGQRSNIDMHHPSQTPIWLAQMVKEIDGVVLAIERTLGQWFDTSKMGIGGMSAGGMATLRRLCQPHGFSCASTEGAAGDLDMLYAPLGHAPEVIQPINPMAHLDSWRPIPLLLLHSEADAIVPIASMRVFANALRARYAKLGSDATLVVERTWPRTGAPDEHSGFGKVAAEAKTIQTDFFLQHLLH